MSAPLKNSETRVAVVVHNDVVKDARVRKEISTLTAAGYIVDVYGVSRERDDYPQTLEGARSLNLVDLSKLNSLHAKLPKLARYAKRLLLNRWSFLLLALVLPGLPLLGLLVREWSPDAFVAARLFYYATPILTAVALARVAGKWKLRGWNDLVMHGSLLCGAFVLRLRGVDLAEYMVILTLTWFGCREAAARRLRSFGGRVKIRMKRPGMSVAGRRLYVRHKFIALALYNRMRGQDYDVIHCHDMIALITGGMLKKADENLRVIWDAHELYEHVASYDEGKAAAMRRIIRRNSRHVDGFVTISPSFQEYYAKNYRLPPARIVMNATRYTGMPVDDGRLREAAGLAAERKILIFQGGFGPRRGLLRLIEAAENLPEPWSIVFMGWGNLSPQIEEAAARLSSGRAEDSAAITILPPAPQEELQTWTAGADLGIIPYEHVGLNHRYCTPNKLWEYPNAGVPILATDLVEIRQMIDEWGTGFLLPREFDAGDIVRAIAAATDAALEEKRARCERFSREMSWKRFEPELLKVYEEIRLESHQSGGPPLASARGMHRPADAA